MTIRDFFQKQVFLNFWPVICIYLFFQLFHWILHFLLFIFLQIVCLPVFIRSMAGFTAHFLDNEVQRQGYGMIQSSFLSSNHTFHLLSFFYEVCAQKMTSLHWAVIINCSDNHLSRLPLVCLYWVSGGKLLVSVKVVPHQRSCHRTITHLSKGILNHLSPSFLW